MRDGDGVDFGYSYQSNTAVLPQIIGRMPADDLAHRAARWSSGC